MPDNLYRSHSIQKDIDSTSGSLTIWEDSPVSPFDVGDTFYPVDNGPALTVERVSIKDNVIGEIAGKTLRQWEITIEGSNQSDNEQTDTTSTIKYNFNISQFEKSGTMEVVNLGDRPLLSVAVGNPFSVPGVGSVVCTNVKGNDEYDDNGNHLWNVTYEGSYKEDESLGNKYSFAIDENGRSGSMSVSVSGDNPNLRLSVGDSFSLPGIGSVVCTKISGDDDGSHIWNITYEGSNEQDEQSEQPEVLQKIKYSFSIDVNEHSGSMNVSNIGDRPALNINIGDSFNIPGIGAVSCSKISGNDDYNDDDSHVWNVTYEGSTSANPDDNDDEEALPKNKYSISIEKDNEGDLLKSGSKTVVLEGETPAFDASVGASFNVPGIGNITCTKVSANDDYSDSGVHRWNITYEGTINESSSDDDDDNPKDKNTKYSFAIDNSSKSGSLEISSSGNNPALIHQVGDSISLPGIGNVVCSKVSGSDSYNENGKRIWTITYECSDDIPVDDDDNNDDEAFIKYSLSIENNSDGITVYSGSKEISCSGNAPIVDISIGDSFSLPLVGDLTCTKIHSSNSDHDSWTVTIEGSRLGDKSDDDNETILPDTEISVTHEINGSTVRSITGEFIALRRSATPITKKSITVYSDSESPIAAPGDSYKGGIVTSENIIKETIKNNGIVTASYYKHSIEVEA